MAVQALVNARSHVDKGLRYELIGVSKNTASLILQGTIKTMDELLKHRDEYSIIKLLLRIQKDTVKDTEIVILETIILDY